MSKKLKDIILPDLGEGIDGAEVSEISVSTGDIVKEGDTIVVLESDKASMEIPSDFDGEIKEVLIATGEEVQIGQLLAKIECEEVLKKDLQLDTEPENTNQDDPSKEDKQPSKTAKRPLPKALHSNDSVFAVSYTHLTLPTILRV